MAQPITVDDIQKIMESAHFTRRDLADELEVHEQSVGYWLKGNVKRIHPRTLKGLNRLKRKHLGSQ